jgi:Flp pilus assembly protein TadG
MRRPPSSTCRLAGPSARSGTAAVEFAAVMTFVLVPLMIGLWEMGRVVHVQQVVANGAREGARLAAQANTINSTGSTTQIMTAVGPTNAAQTPNVKAAVMQYLSGAGLSKLTWNDVTVTFAFTSGNTALTDPYQGSKGQKFGVTVTLNQAALDKCLWTALGLVKPSSVTYTVNWQIMVDDPFSINANLPTW